jgi:hypothetical protein
VGGRGGPALPCGRVPALALLLLLAAGPAAAAEAVPDDAAVPAAEFADRQPASIALGPVPRGRPFLSADLGWLRSGARFDLGMGIGLDFTLRIDTMALYAGFGGQTGVHAGLRWTFVEEAFRGTVEASAGKVFQPTDPGFQSMTTIEGGLAAGVVLEVGTVYARVTFRGMGGEAFAGIPTFRREVEAGGGVERGWRRFVFGAEGFVLNRPGHAGLGEWRLRAGVSF